MNQHTGNWPGKTVGSAYGRCKNGGRDYVLVDLPGTYSLAAHSAEEETARDFICFGNADAVAVVCDATCLERNLNLVLQILEITGTVVVGVNLMDEAKKKGIFVDCKALSSLLGVPVVPMSARSGKGLDHLMKELCRMMNDGLPHPPRKLRYLSALESALEVLEPALSQAYPKENTRVLALKLLENEEKFLSSFQSVRGIRLLDNEEINAALESAKEILFAQDIDADHIEQVVTSCVVLGAEEICLTVVHGNREKAGSRDRRLDRIFTGKWGIPVMLLLLAVVFWLTIAGANYPSQLLADGLFWVEEKIRMLFVAMSAPGWLTGILIDGVYHVLAWVVSVMLPPMAIFFPLFTLLEDSGYLPRVAFNLDASFKKACACGKQALTCCMGLGCNAAGVVGARIIDSPRERMIAILTNNFMPCNGRFPTLITLITIFITGGALTAGNSLLSVLCLLGVIVLGVAMTLFLSKLLSKTILKGLPSSFAMELPPYRRPLIGKVLVHSIFDRTLFVLGRAVAVAAPAGAVIWLMANLSVDGVSLLNHCAAFLDPFASWFGIDGVILMAFILGFPANAGVIISITWKTQ